MSKVIKLTEEQKSKYRRYGVNINSKYFKNFYQKGLLDLSGIDFEYIQQIQQYYKKHFKNEIDTRDHIIYYNVTGKKDVKIIPTSVLRGGAKGGYLINYLNDRGMINAYGDKSLYDNIFHDFKRANNVIKRVRSKYMNKSGKILSRTEVINILLKSHKEYIIKRSDTDDGKSIAKIKIKGSSIYLKDKKITLEFLEKEYGSNFLVQQVIKQHETMAKLHPASVNTLRMVTLRINDEINYLYTFTRFGVNNDVKDNAGSGGLVVGVKDNGEFMDYGIYKNEKIDHHPTTKVKISDLVNVPNFNLCKEKVKKMHEKIIHHDFASWDIAVGEDGLPVFIEVNFFGTSLLNQLALGRPLFGDLTEQVLEEASSKFSTISTINTENFYSKLHKKFVAKNKEYIELEKQNKNLKNHLDTIKQNTSMVPIEVSETSNTRPLIGMLRYYKQPTANIEYAAQYANKLNCDFIFFHPEGVDTLHNQISGLLYKNGKWLRSTTRLPDVVDNAKSQRKYRNILLDLEKKVPFTTQRIGNKDVIANRLMEQRMFANMVIPYEYLKNSEQTLHYLDKHEKIIIKPTNQRRGKGIYLVMKHENEYLLHDGKDGYIVSKEVLQEEITSLVKPNMMVQPFIQSFTKEGRPFDIRIHVRRNGQGEWETLAIYPRLGEIGSVSSTTNATVSEDYTLENLLNENFDSNKAKAITAEINAFTKLFPQKLQDNYSKPLDALGIDLGIDEYGKIWIFEVNTSPDAELYGLLQEEKRIDYLLFCSGKSVDKPMNSKPLAEKKRTIALFSIISTSTELKTACAAIAAANNLNFFYFTPKGMDLENNTVNGFYYENGEWKKKIYSLTEDIDIIYDRIRKKGFSRYDKYYQALKHLTFTHENFSNTVNKGDVAKKFENYKSLNKWLIPTFTYTIETFYECIEEHKKIILKPINGSYGIGLYLIENQGDYYHINNKHKKYNISKAEMGTWLRENINKRYMVQPFIKSRTKEDLATDVRVHLIRGKAGEWCFLSIYPRLGVEYEKITPMSEGGYIGKWKGFATHQYGKENFDFINNEIKKATLEIVKVFEHAYNKKITEAGLDFLIDENLNVYFIEINVRQPGIAFYEFKLAENIIQYSKHLINQKYSEIEEKRIND